MIKNVFESPVIFMSLLYYGHLLHHLFLNGLQVNGGEVFDRDFTKSLIIRDFDEVLKNPFRYVVLFSLHKLL